MTFRTFWSWWPILATISPLIVSAQPSYRATLVTQNSIATRLSENGWVSGRTFNGQHYIPFRWKAGVLNTFPGFGYHAAAHGINNAGAAAIARTDSEGGGLLRTEYAWMPNGQLVTVPPDNAPGIHPLMLESGLLLHNPASPSGAEIKKFAPSSSSNVWTFQSVMAGLYGVDMPPRTIAHAGLVNDHADIQGRVTHWGGNGIHQ